MQAVERLKESIQLLQTARPYFTMKPTPKCTCSECPEVNPTPIENEGSDSYNKPILLKLVVDVSQAYFDIGLGQFDGFVHKQGKQVLFVYVSNILQDKLHDVWLLFVNRKYVHISGVVDLYLDGTICMYLWWLASS